MSDGVKTHCLEVTAGINPNTRHERARVIVIVSGRFRMIAAMAKFCQRKSLHCKENTRSSQSKQTLPHPKEKKLILFSVRGKVSNARKIQENSQSKQALPRPKETKKNPFLWQQTFFL